MPKITQNQEGGSIVYDKDDWLAGMDTTSSGNSHGITGGNPQMLEIDPLRKYGYATVSFNPVDVTNISSITSLITNGVVKGDNFYMIGGDLVHKMSSMGSGSISTTAPFPHTIAHGAHTGETAYDIVNYYIYNGGTQKLCAFYSFQDGTDWDVGIYDYDADTFDDDFMSTVPTSPLAAPYLTGGAGFPHPLIVGDDDVLYIGDRNFVHAYDQTTGVFSAAVLTLPKGWIITCFTTTQDLQLAIGAYFTTGQGTGSAYNRGMAKVWFWSYLALDIDYSRDLNDNYVSEILPWGTTIVAFTQGRKSLTERGIYKLQVLKGSQFEIVKSWNTGGIPTRGGADTSGSDLYWNGGGAIYAFTKRPDNGQYILNNIFTQGSSGGIFRFLTGSATYHSSFGAGTGNGLRYFASNYNDVGTLGAQVASPIFPVNMQGDLVRVTIKFGDTFSGGRAFRLNTALDYSSIVLVDDMITLTSTRKVQVTKRTDGTPLGQFNSIQPVLTWSDNLGGNATDAPEVEWIRYDYKLVIAK